MKKTISMLWITMLASMGAIVRNDAVTIDTLKQKLVDLNNHANDIQALADGEDRPLTPEESAKIDEIFAEFETVEADLKRRERIAAQASNLAATPGRQTQPDPAGAPMQNNTNQQPAGQQPATAYRNPRDPVVAQQGGFRDFGEFAVAVCRGSRRANASIDPRLVFDAPTSYGNEGVGADGGFAVPPAFKAEIMELIEDEENLLARTDQLTTGSNNLTLPTDETTPWQTSGGIQAYWEGEGNQLTQSKPDLKSNTHRLKKLTALVPMTEELLEDASAMDSYLRRKVPSKMDFKITNAIINGTGSGQPLGFRNSGALIQVAKESGQTADTVVYENIVKMWSRMYGPSRRNAIWLINQDIEPQLDTMSFEGTSSSVPVYLPPGGVADAPYGRLKGRPVIPTQAAKTLGDEGDIMLVDLKQYMSLIKTGGMRSDVSMHLYFDYDMMAFRFILRIDGQPYLSAPIDPLNGTSTLSPFVSLAARA